ncbi:hypothetical protein [Anoxybacteroides tepidamans]|uniref:hypothetical protein n=1 Tax=Anoxybacteroides tepidamans TaxID=265948 RepID=UPI00047FCB19|nr:hypothetical protein [Anoxybacillus tepidamans]
MKDVHETEATRKFLQTDDDRIFSATEDLENIVRGGIWKRNSFDFHAFPKWIKYVGFFIVSWLVAICLLVFFLNLFF